MRILPFRLPERSALLAVCLSAASTQCVGKLHYEEARSALAVGTRDILPFRLPERSALLAVCLSAASTQCVGKLHYEEARSALAVGTRENMKENSGSNRRNFLTTNEAAQRLGVSYYTVYEYIREKRLVAEMVSGVYIIPEKAVEEFKAKPTGRTRVNPPPWRVYRAGAKVRGLDIHVQALPGQQEPLMEKFHLMLEQQQHLFHGTMQRYIFEEENDP